MSDFDELASEYSDEGEFKIHNELKPPVTSTGTTAYLHGLIHQGGIDLNPEYQRDVVWTESKQISLIESIFRHYYIPPLVFAVHTDEDGEETRICVDGKQRLTSIQKFMDGQIPYKDPVTGKKYYYTRAESQKGRLELPDAYKKRFANKQITYVEYHDLKASVERDIFQRVQLGVALTPAEKLQAIMSPWSEWVRALQKKYIESDGGFSEVMTWDTKRGRDFQCFAQLVFCLHRLPNYGTFQVPMIEKWITRDDPPDQGFKKFVDDVLSSFLHIASTPGLNKGFKEVKQRIAPVEFVCIGTLLGKMRHASWEDKAEAIYNMRVITRNKHKDVRTNERVIKTMNEFVQNVKFISLKDDDDFVGTTDGGLKKKRKRKGAEEDEDGDYRPPPVRGLGPAPKTRPKPGFNSAVD